MPDRFAQPAPSSLDSQRSFLDLLLEPLQLLRGPAGVQAPRPRSEINLQWLIHLRWAAIGGQLITVLVVSLLLRVELPNATLLAVIAAEFASNALLLIIVRRWVVSTPTSSDGAKDVDGLQSIQLGVTILDTVFLGVLLALTGGLSNPFCAFLVIYAALSAVLLPIRYALTAVAAVVLVLLGMLRFSQPIGVLSSDTEVRGWGMVVAIGLTSLLSVFFVSRVTATLARRSEQLEAERERRGRRRHLEALGTLAAGAAHELGTPLSTIAIVAKELELRLARSQGNEVEQADATLIRDEVARCRRILDRMSTDAGGGIGEQLVPTSARELADLVVGEMAAKDRVLVEFDLPGASGEGKEVPYVIPRQGLATSIRAIIQNSIDASAGDSSVRLVLRRPKGRLQIFVADVGVGMSPDEVERAKEPFFTTKEVGRGMGLGLYLASSFCENLGGRLEILSEVGTGTTVRMDIPVPITGGGMP